MPLPRGTKTQSRSCRCRIAVAGTAAVLTVCLPWKVAVTNMPRRIIPGFAHFEAHLRGAQGGVENRQDVADPALQRPCRDKRSDGCPRIAEVHGVEIVLVHVADDPDVGQIGNGERVGAGRALHARRVGDLLVGDHARDRSDDIDDARRDGPYRRRAAQLFGGGFQIDLGSCSVSSACSRALLAMAPWSKELGAIQLLPRQPLVVLGLPISRNAPETSLLRTLQQQLALLHRVAQPRVNLHHPAGGQRDRRARRGRYRAAPRRSHSTPAPPCARPRWPAETARDGPP